MAMPYNSPLRDKKGRFISQRCHDWPLIIALAGVACVGFACWIFCPHIIEKPYKVTIVKLVPDLVMKATLEDCQQDYRENRREIRQLKRQLAVKTKGESK